jgi:hypothetical protein
MNRILARCFVTVMAFVFLGSLSETRATEIEQSLVSFSSGALLVQKPPEDSDSCYGEGAEPTRRVGKKVTQKRSRYEDRTRIIA